MLFIMRNVSDDTMRFRVCAPPPNLPDCLPQQLSSGKRYNRCFLVIWLTD